MRENTGGIVNKKTGRKQNSHCRRRIIYTIGVVFLLVLLSATARAASDELTIGNFSSLGQKDILPADWKPLVFKKIKTRTRYRHILVDGQGVIEAQSEKGASGLIRKMAVDPAQYPIITWRWKVKNILQKGDVSKKSGDDYPARIYITFAYDSKKVGFWEEVKFDAYKMLYGEYPPMGAINYIWANKARTGRILPNPYTDRVKMIVIESGSAKAGQWLVESRNIVDDYRAAFQADPPSISGIAIMTDTDNTGESAAAWYGDITMRRK